MTQASHARSHGGQLLNVSLRYWRRWLVPLVGCTVLAGAYAFLRTPKWEASQTVLLRNEAVSTGDESLGRFRSIEDLQLTQETVLEVAQSHSVLKAVLEEAGLPATPEGIADLRDMVSIVPPDGAEFGKTELFYIKVKDKDPEAAKKLASLLGQHLQDGLQRLRTARTAGVIEELEKGVTLAQADLDEASRKLAAIESEVGGDLADLRMLDITATGDSDLRRQLSSVQDELRTAERELRANQETLDLLKEAQRDSGRLLAMPTDLLARHPGLAKLKDGLVAAQLKTAELMGLMTEHHPLVKAALEAEQQISRQLDAELVIAVRGAEVDYRLNAARVADLKKRQGELERRLNTLAALRTDYSTLAAQVKHRTQLLEQVERALATARTAEAAATNASQISLVDSPIVGNRPVGPGKSLILAAGFVAGAMLGGGLLLLSVDAAEFRPAPREIPMSTPSHNYVNDRLTSDAVMAAAWPFETVGRSRK